MYLIDIFSVVEVFFNGKLETDRPVKLDRFALFENRVTVVTKAVNSSKTALEGSVRIFHRIGVPSGRSMVGGDNNQPGVEGNSASLDLDIKRVTIQELEKNRVLEPRTSEVVKDDNLLVLVTVPPFGLVLVVGIWVDNRRKVGLSKSRGTVEDKDMRLEPPLRDGSKTVEGGDPVVLGNDRKRFRIAPDVPDRNTGVEALLEKKKISSFALLGLFTVSPRTVDSRLLLGTVSLGFFMLSTAKLPVSTRVEKLHCVKRLIGLEADVALIVRGSFVTSFHLPDTI